MNFIELFLAHTEKKKNNKGKMKLFNAIQIVVLLMISPTLLTMARTATFSGAGALFWGALIGVIALAITSIVLVYSGMEN